MINSDTKKQKVILLVDDIPENLELLARNLQRKGYKALLATSGAQALEIALAKLPDLILLDVQMPVMNGFEVCKRLKQNPDTKHIPVIFLTAKTEQDSIVEAFSIGAVDYVLKPFYNEELFARVNTHLQLKELSDEIEDKNEKLRQYVDMIEHNIAISQTDADGIMLYASEALCELSGYSKEELVGRKHNCLKSGCTSAEVYDELWSTIKSGRQWSGELLDKKKDGELFWVHITITPKLNEDASIAGYMAIWHDITDRKMVEELVITDPLTKLYNRRHLENELNKVIGQHKRDSKSFGFLMMDIDYFKAYNDFYGHQMGDKALIAVANAIKECLHRAGDVAFRFGGEEFCAILPNTDADGAKKVAEEIRSKIEALDIKHQKSPFGYVSVSVGVATMQANDADFDNTVRVSDKALYAAKNNGRNRVESV